MHRTLPILTLLTLALLLALGPAHTSAQPGALQNGGLETWASPGQPASWTVAPTAVGAQVPGRTGSAARIAVPDNSNGASMHQYGPGLSGIYTIELFYRSSRPAVYATLQVGSGPTCYGAPTNTWSSLVCTGATTAETLQIYAGLYIGDQLAGFVEIDDISVKSFSTTTPQPSTTPSATPTSTATAMTIATPSGTPTSPPTHTPTTTATAAPPATATPSSSPTATSTPTLTPTATGVPTASPTPFRLYIAYAVCGGNCDPDPDSAQLVPAP